MSKEKYQDQPPYEINEKIESEIKEGYKEQMKEMFLQLTKKIVKLSKDKK